MKQGGIRSYRIPLVWSGVWPSNRESRSTGSYFDRQVALAAQANLNVLPFVLLDAFLAGRGLRGRSRSTAGAQRTAWSAFLRAAVKRYGPHG